MQGSTDLQARLADAKGLADDNPAAQLLLIEGMNHVLKTVPNDPARQVASYSDSTLPVAPELISGVTSFVNAKLRSRRTGLTKRLALQTATVAASSKATGEGFSPVSPTKKVRWQLLHS